MRFLATNWTDQPPQYSEMVGFGTVFVAASLAFAIVAQGFYRPQPLFEKARFVDEILGGLLGLLQAAIILAAVVIILDSYYRLTGIPQSASEIQLLRNLWSALDESRIVEVFRVDAHPGVLHRRGAVHPELDQGALPEQSFLSILDRGILAGATPDVARTLLGARLVRDDGTGRRVARIVEVEAYGGPDDRASHARFGSTRRNRVMAGPAGVAYVYLVYGMYDCLNVVTGAEGAPSAVLIRAVEPLAGLERMRVDRLTVEARRRSSRTPEGLEAARARLTGTPDHRLASGPGLVAAAFGIDTSWTGVDLCAPDAPLRLERDPADPDDTVAPESVAASTRVGVAYAGDEWASRAWRFIVAGHRSVSGPRVR